MLIQLSLIGGALLLISFSLLKCFFEQGTGSYPGMSRIADLIRLGANSCIRTQYLVLLAPISLVYAFALFLDWTFGNSILIGAAFSTACVFFSLYVSMRWNLLTAISSLESVESGFNKAFESGRIISASLLGMCLLTSGICLFYDNLNIEKAVLGISIGSAFISAFSRISGGIFTKAADIVADLVGKVLNDMPEDDPRNPAVIADNIGDNVGDGSGTMCEIFSSYVTALACAVFIQKGLSWLSITALLCSSIASLFAIGFTRMKRNTDQKDIYDSIFLVITKIIDGFAYYFILFIAFLLGRLLYDLLESATFGFLVGLNGWMIPSLIQSIFAFTLTWIMNLLLSKLWIKSSDISKANSSDRILSTITIMVLRSVGLSLCFAFGYKLIETLKAQECFCLVKATLSVLYDTSFFIPFFLGILTIPAGMLVTVYYSSRNFAPVANMARACSSGGAAMNLIYGYSYSLDSAAVTGILFSLILLPLSIICKADGIIVALFAILGFIPSIMSMDAYGPICDNAGSIATMSDSDPIARENTDELDSIGNMVKALTKSYIGILSIITTFTLIKICILILKDSSRLSLMDPVALVAMLIGASVPFLFSGVTIRAVGEAADYIFPTVIDTIQNGDHSNTEYYSKPIRMLTIKSLISSIKPIIAIFLPIASAVMLIPLVTDKTTIMVYLIFSIIGNAFTSILLSISMTIGGGALDNTKKLVESNFPKGHDARKAAVIGDTFGDPIKDTSGPSLIASLRIFLLLSLWFFYRVGGSISN